MRIALISDIHFGKLARSKEFVVPGDFPKDNTSGTIPLSTSLVEILKEKEVEYIFIAGDLTSTGSPLEFHYCEKKLLEIASSANISKEHIIWGIGNHDLDWNISELGAGFDKYSTELQNIVKDKYRMIAASVAEKHLNDLPQEFIQGPAPLSGVVEKDDFVVFVLNSSLYCTKDQTFSHGKLGSEQLCWLKNKISEYKDNNKWKIVLMHHHSYNYPYHTLSTDVSTIEEGPELIEIFSQGGINLVCHGHRHHPRAETIQKTGWGNPITFICAGSLSVNAEHRSSGDIPNTFHIIELSKTIGQLKLFNYQYTSSKGWVPFRENTPETPMDFTMSFGKIIDATRKEEMVLNLINHKKSPISVKCDELDDDFNYLSYKDVNNTIKELLSNRYTIVGSFPNHIMLIEKQEEQK